MVSPYRLVGWASRSFERAGGWIGSANREEQEQVVNDPVSPIRAYPEMTIGRPV